MGKVIVVEFMSLDGVTHDPDGSDGSPQGGWVFRYGPEAVANDPFGDVVRPDRDALAGLEAAEQGSRGLF